MRERLATSLKSKHQSLWHTWKNSGIHSGSTTASSSSRLASASPAMSSWHGSERAGESSSIDLSQLHAHYVRLTHLTPGDVSFHLFLPYPSFLHGFNLGCITTFITSVIIFFFFLIFFIFIIVFLIRWGGACIRSVHSLKSQIFPIWSTNRGFGFRFIFFIRFSFTLFYDD